MTHDTTLPLDIVIEFYVTDVNVYKTGIKIFCPIYEIDQYQLHDYLQFKLLIKFMRSQKQTINIITVKLKP